MRRVRMLTGPVTAAVLACAVPGAAATPAATPAAASAGGRGFAYVMSYLTGSEANHPYAPDPRFNRNSTGATNTVRRVGTGHYVVHIPKLGGGGIAHVTTKGLLDATCQVGSWTPPGIDVELDVRCFDGAGAPIDDEFTAVFISRPAASRIAYLWADQPTTTSYAPSSRYQFSSTGRVNTVERQGPGGYLVRLPGLGRAGGHVQVTAFGVVAARCQVADFSPSGMDQLVDVRCFDVDGAPSDSRFTMTYVDGRGLLGTNPASYVQANIPGYPSEYEPDARYRYNSSGGTDSVFRTNPGEYGVRMPGMPLFYGSVQVTAYGAGSQRCGIEYWNGLVVVVLCRTATGKPADAMFDVAYFR